MDGDNDDWQVYEEHSFVTAAHQIGVRLVDDALGPVMLGLNRNPLGFRKVPTFSDIYFARTKFRILNGDVLPSLTLWFRPKQEARSVALLYVELSRPNEMMAFDEDYS